MNITNFLTSVSPARWTVFCMGAAAVLLFAPGIAHAAVAFGEIGQNVADNAKGVAKGITMGGFAAGAGMGVWGCIEMYYASFNPNRFYCVQIILLLQEILAMQRPIGFNKTYGHTPMPGGMYGGK